MVRSTRATSRSSRATVWLNRSSAVVEGLHRRGQLGDQAGVLLDHLLQPLGLLSACFIRSPTTGIDPTAGGTRELLAMAALNRIAVGQGGVTATTPGSGLVTSR